MTPPQVTLTDLLLISPSAQKAAIKSRLWDLLQTDSASPVYLLISSFTCIVNILRCSAFAVCMWQTVSVEFPSAWWSSEDWPYDGGLRHPLLRLQPRCLPVNWWASICILYSYFLFETVCERAEVFFKNYHTIFVFLIFTSSFLLFFVLSPCHWFCISLFSTKNAYVKHWLRLPLILCVRVHLPLNPRHVLHPVFCHHHVEHEPSQPQCEGQNHSGAFHLHEQRHQQWRGPTQWSVVGENLSKTQSQRPRRRQEAIT